MDELRETARAWDRAMIANDVDSIGRFMAADWIIVGTDGHITDRDTFLEQIRSGELSHHTMTTEAVSVRVYSGVGVLVAEGISAGRYQGREFHVLERQSNVFVKDGGTWRCVLTHLSPLSRPPGGGAA